MFLCLVHSTARAIPRLGGSMKYPVCFLPMKRDIHNKSDIIKWFKALNCLFCPKLPPHLIFFLLLLSGSDGTFPHYVGKSVLSLTSFHLPFFPLLSPYNGPNSPFLAVRILLYEQALPPSPRLDPSSLMPSTSAPAQMTWTVWHESWWQSWPMWRRSLQSPLDAIPPELGWRIWSAWILRRCGPIRAGHTWK